MRTLALHTDASTQSVALDEEVVRSTVIRDILLLEGIGIIGRVLRIDLVLIVLLGLFIQLIIA